jgi:hypothetical protein
MIGQLVNLLHSLCVGSYDVLKQVEDCHVSQTLSTATVEQAHVLVWNIAGEV